jgi:hypothetical protein
MEYPFHNKSIMKIKFTKFIIPALMLSFLFFPSISFAGIVPCGGDSDPCTLCHLIIGIKNLVDFGKNILVTATIVAIFISGIIYIVSTGNEKMITKAKTFLSASLIGFALTLGAWLLVNVTIFWIANAKTDLGINVANWFTFTCDTSSSALTGTTGNVGIGETTVGSGKVVEAAKQMMNANCYYCNTFSGQPFKSSRTHGPDNCALNACSGTPGFTDCADFANAAYRRASCSVPGGNATSMYNRGSAIGDSSSLKEGDILSTPSHSVICENDGCSRVIHASGIAEGIKESNGSYYIQQGAHVLRASAFCSSSS